MQCVKQLKKLPEGDVLHFDRDHEGSQQIRLRITEEVSNVIVCTYMWVSNDLGTVFLFL